MHNYCQKYCNCKKIGCFECPLWCWPWACGRAGVPVLFSQPRHSPISVVSRRVHLMSSLPLALGQQAGTILATSTFPPFLWSACRVHLMCLCPWPWGSRRYYSRNLCYDISVVSPPNSIHAFIVLVYNFWIFNSPKTLNVIGFSNSV